jgi:hypothetical protein
LRFWLLLRPFVACLPTTTRWAGPAVAPDGTVYATSVDHHLYAIRGDGQLIWSVETGNCSFSSPTIAPRRHGLHRLERPEALRRLRRRPHPHDAPHRRRRRLLAELSGPITAR